MHFLLILLLNVTVTKDQLKTFARITNSEYNSKTAKNSESF